jgi:hypothetical protein
MTRTKQGFLTASTLMNDRLQRMNSILDEEVRQTGIIYRQVAALHATAGVEINSIAFIANEIAKFIQVYSDLFHLELAIDSLSHGNLSPSLIDIHHVRALIANISARFEGTPNRLCYRTPQRVYATKDFQVVRHEKNVLVRIKIPYTSTQALTVYETKTFRLPVVGKQGFQTQLKQLPRYFVVNIAHRMLAA